MLGVLSVEGDRFSLRGDSFVRIYFKYAASLHTTMHLGHKISFDTSFARHVVKEAIKKRRRELLIDRPMERIFAERSNRKELGDTAVGRWLREFQQGARERDLSRMASARLVPRYNSEKAEPEDKMLFIGTVFSVGVDRLEHGELWLTTDEVDETELTAMTETWIGDNRALLRKYDTEVEQLFVALLDSRLVRDLVIYANPETAMNQGVHYFSVGEFESSVRKFLEVVRVLEQKGKGQEGSTIRHYIGEAYNSAGFVTAVVGNSATAETYVRRALQTDSYQRWLRQYNLAYLSAMDRDFASAVKWASQAEESFAKDSREHPSVLMLAYFPTPATWTPPNPKWNVITVDTREQTAGFLKAQRRTYQIISGESQVAGDLALLDGIKQPLSEGCLRLAAWVELTIRQNPRAARAWLLAAIQETEKASTEFESRVQEAMEEAIELAEVYGLKWKTEPEGEGEKEEEKSSLPMELAFVDALLGESEESASVQREDGEDLRDESGSDASRVKEDKVQGE